MMTRAILLAGAVSLSMAGGAFAAGGGGDTTSSTKKCDAGMVYDKKKKKCVDAERAPDDALFEAAVNAAYGGQYQTTIDLLSFADNQDDPRILNYLGFAHRKLGLTADASGYYQKALSIDPDYNLARSYYGQGMIVDGNVDGAKVQLAEIRNRGGEGTWAYVMLENAIASGVTY